MFFVDGKFITLFSFLFAVGFTIQLHRGTDRGRGRAGLYARRLAVLAVFGCIHMALLWFGDILLMYSLTGAALLAVRGWRPGLSMLVVAAVLILFTRVAFDIVTAEPESAPRPPAATAQPDSRHDEAFVAFQGGYASVVRQNVLTAYRDFCRNRPDRFSAPADFRPFPARALRRPTWMAARRRSRGASAAACAALAVHRWGDRERPRGCERIAS